MTTQKILDFISRTPGMATPVMILDLDAAMASYDALRAALPTAAVYYAVKANPDETLLYRLAARGSSFDTASVREIELALEAGAPAERISFGNTIKKERDVARAFELGVRLFSVDCVEEVEKVGRAAPGSAVYCRVLTDGEGAEWPLSRKFGCDPEMAAEVLLHARDAGLSPVGVSFHVGSQQCDLDAWDRAISDAAKVFGQCRETGIVLDLLNMGGGFPARYLKDVPSAAEYGRAISSSLARHFGDAHPKLIIEPGRGLVGEAGAILSEVVLVSRKSKDDKVRWVYLDVGKFGGLAETMDEAIRYPISTPRDGRPSSPCIVAGPTCDSADVLYEKVPYRLPVDLKAGDRVIIGSTGAYTTTYSAVAFNGFEPLASVSIG